MEREECVERHKFTRVRMIEFVEKRLFIDINL